MKIISLLVLAALGCLAVYELGFAPSKPALTPPSFHFDVRDTRAILLSKTDPASGDHWDARVTRTDAAADWKIAAGPEGMPLGDRFANTGFINHLLDTLRTAQSHEAPLSGTLESFGLSVPRYRVQWDGFDLRVGAPGKTTDHVNGETVIGSYTTTDGKAVWVTTGAALEMLGRLTSFDSLRENQLVVLRSGETEDDIYQIAISRARERRPFFYAERVGVRWADLKKKPIHAGNFLEKLAHLRVLRFVDNGTESKKIASQPPFLKISLKDRAGTPVLIELRPQANHVFATVSTRVTETGPAVFEVYPDVLTWIKLL